MAVAVAGLGTLGGGLAVTGAVGGLMAVAVAGVGTVVLRSGRGLHCRDVKGLARRVY